MSSILQDRPASTDIDALIAGRIARIAETTWALRTALPAAAGLDDDGRILLCLRNHDGTGYVKLAMSNDLSQHVKLMMESRRLEAERAIGALFDTILRTAPVLDAPGFALRMMVSVGRRRAVQFSVSIEQDAFSCSIADCFTPRRRTARAISKILKKLSALPAWDGTTEVDIPYFHRSRRISATNIETAHELLLILDEHEP